MVKERVKENAKFNPDEMIMFGLEAL